MGAGMALNLLSRGWEVHVHDIVAERRDALAAAGARVHATAADRKSVV